MSNSIATDRSTSQCNDENGNCTNIGTRYKLAYQCQTMSSFSRHSAKNKE